MNDTDPVFRHRNCPLCRGDGRQVWSESNARMEALDRFAFASRKTPEFMHFRLLRCEACDLVYVSPAPDPAWMADSYREAAFDAGAESRYAARSYRRELDRIAHRLPGRGAALDVGAGDGAFVMELLNAGFSDPVGIEPSLAPVQKAPAEVRRRLRNEFFRSDSVPSGTLDFASCFQILEHVENPLDVCRTLHDMLAPGGAIMAVAHDYRSLSARILGERSPIYDIEHLQLFSSASLRRLLEGAGFTNVEVRSLRNAYPLAYWLRLLPLPQRLKDGAGWLMKQLRICDAVVSLHAGNLVATGFRP